MSNSLPAKLPLMEMFYTLQGEGVYAGQAAFFIRLGGCDVGCVWCDVKESWDAAAHPQVSVEEIVETAAQYPARIAVITGGEPAMYNLLPLCHSLQRLGFRVHIETSGAYPLLGRFDWITVSPKKFKAPLDEVVSRADELKVIVFNRSDFSWAEAHATHCSEKCIMLLQPEWDKSAEMTPLIIDYVKSNPRWRISLQTHKWMNIP
jgi:7-carboxy-7-deazaguanine synthase